MEDEAKNRARDSSILLMLASGALASVLLFVTAVSVFRGETSKVWGVLVFGAINALICAFSWLRAFRAKREEPIQAAETTRGK